MTKRLGLEVVVISVVVSVFNMERYLQQCIDSLLAQTYSDFELLLIDDGSTDKSPEICDRYEKKCGCIRAYHKENGGLSSARNYGMDRAKGDFIIFPDPDDWVEPTYLEELLEIRKRNDADLSICGLYRFAGGRRKAHDAKTQAVILNTEEGLKWLLHPNRFCGFAWNKLYDLRVIRESDLRFDEELGMVQDLHFAFRYFLQCERIAYDPRPLYYYRYGGVTNKESPLTARKMSALKTYQKIADIAANSPYPGLEKDAYRSLYNSCLRNVYSYYNGNTQDPALLEQLRKTMKACKGSFFPNDVYPLPYNLLGRLALISPRLYYEALHAKRIITGTARRNTVR